MVTRFSRRAALGGGGAYLLTSCAAAPEAFNLLVGVLGLAAVFTDSKAVVQLSQFVSASVSLGTGLAQLGQRTPVVVRSPVTEARDNDPVTATYQGMCVRTDIPNQTWVRYTDRYAGTLAPGETASLPDDDYWRSRLPVGAYQFAVDRVDNDANVIRTLGPQIAICDPAYWNYAAILRDQAPNVPYFTNA